MLGDRFKMRSDEELSDEGKDDQGSGVTPDSKRKRVHNPAKDSFLDDLEEQVFASPSFNSSIDQSLYKFFGNWKEDLGSRMDRIEKRSEDVFEEITRTRSDLEKMKVLSDKIGKLEESNSKIKEELREIAEKMKDMQPDKKCKKTLKTR